MLRKIGIATYANYNNYGSLLQRFALQEVLATMGFQGESLYIAKTSRTNKRIWDKLICNLPKMRERDRRFQQFVTQKAPLKIFQTEEELAARHEEYDAFLAGSDQIWRDPLSFFFLKFANNRPKVSYAASGLDHLPQEQWTWASQALAQFDHLSVREKNNIGLVEKIAHRNAIHALDPTLLLDASVWNTLAVPARKNKPYLFCYFVQSRRRPLAYMPQAPCDYFFDLAQTLARQSGLDPVFLCGAPKGYLPFNFSQEAGAGPQEFLGLIRDAAMVITDSYHATLFAIQFQKPFFALPVAWKKAKNDESMRHWDILNMLGLSRRFLPLDSPVPAPEEIPLDFTDATLRLAQERERSLGFLRGALTSVT